EDRRQWGNINTDSTSGSLKEIFVGMREQDDRLFGVVYPFIGKTRLVIDEQRNRILPGDVRCCDDDELVPRNVRGKFDPEYLSACDFTSDRCAEDHAGEDQIIDVLGTAGHLVATFFSRNRLPDDGLARH